MSEVSRPRLKKDYPVRVRLRQVFFRHKDGCASAFRPSTIVFPLSPRCSRRGGDGEGLLTRGRRGQGLPVASAVLKGTPCAPSVLRVSDCIAVCARVLRVALGGNGSTFQGR